MFKVASSREYYSKIRVNRTELNKLRRAQRAVLDKGIYGNDSAALSNSLTAISLTSSLAALFFIASTAAGIASGVIGIVSSLGAAISTPTNLLEKGYISLVDMQDFMDDNRQYDIVEFDIPFLEYKSTTGEVIRFCEATSTKGWTVTAVHSSGGWQYV